MRSLWQDGVPVLELCLDRQPMEPLQVLNVLQQLASAEAWSKRDPDLANQDSHFGRHSCRPLPEQQAWHLELYVWTLRACFTS